jgi:hypothetical protein
MSKKNEIPPPKNIIPIPPVKKALIENLSTWTYLSEKSIFSFV